MGLSKVLSQWDFSQVATGNERMRVRHRSVKMRVRILTSCKNRVKTSYKQEEGRKRLKVKETKRGREEEAKDERRKNRFLKH